MSSTEDLLERAERAFERHLQPVYNRDDTISSSKLFAKVVQAARLIAGRLPLDNLQDAGAVYEWFTLYHDQDSAYQDLPSLPAPPSSTEQLNIEMRNRFAQEELREAAWLAAGQHGFAALAEIPELQQLLQRCCMTAVDESVVSVQVRSLSTDERFRALLDGDPLLHHLVPQLRLCLLAEVAAGLLVPGHPLPPDTPEHGAALQFMLASAVKMLKQEVSEACSPVLTLSTFKDFQLLMHSLASLQLAAPGHELLEQMAEDILLQARQNNVRGIMHPEQLISAICYGREKLVEQLHHWVGQQLQQQGLNPDWFTIHDAGTEAGSVSSGSDSEGESPRGSSRGGWFGSLQRQQQQQQQRPEGASECAAAIKAGGQALSALDEMWEAAAMQPARKFVSQWMREEQQQQQAAAAGPAAAPAAGGGSAAAASSLPGAAAASFTPGDPQQAWRDAFGWRRLLWGLLGRIKPTAQAWYVQYYGMCPHCPDHKLWAAVCRSVMRHLWVPPGADAVAWQLSGPYCPLHIARQEQQARMALYARALNAAFQAGAGSCEGQPLMWHVWWHIGIRRYHFVQQQQQQQQQQRRQQQQQQQDEDLAEDTEQSGAQLGKSPQGTTSKSSKARMKQRARKQQQQQQALEAAQQAGLAPLSAGQLASLYADPAARYYAAGFAARQTAAYGPGLRARAALRTPHMIASRVVSEKLQAGRVFALARELWSSDRDETSRSINVFGQLLASNLEPADPARRLGRPAFPPLFRPEGQVDCVDAALGDEGLMLSRAGEAQQLMALGDAQCLVGPAAQQWWQRYQRVMMARCDACGEALSEQQQQQRRSGADSVPSCAACGIPRYCSGACQARDEQHHAALCSYLSAARQRHHAWRVLQLLQPEPGPLGMACQAFAV
ncbi:hypothetical protein OEZ86_009087 [Tetradesmus obliquus]|nr:hypothetical protein OEZ86_009087 [Tetradesmus obliquus]